MWNYGGMGPKELSIIWCQIKRGILLNIVILVGTKEFCRIRGVVELGGGGVNMEGKLSRVNAN